MPYPTRRHAAFRLALAALAVLIGAAVTTPATATTVEPGATLAATPGSDSAVRAEAEAEPALAATPQEPAPPPTPPSGPPADRAEEAATGAEAGDDLALMARARRHLAAGDRPAAFALLEGRAAEADASSSLVAFLGGLYLQAGQPEDTLALFHRRPGGLEAADAEILFIAARAAQATGDEAGAEEFLERSAALAPRSRAAILLASLRSTAGRHADAERLLRPIVEGEALAAAAQADPAFASEIARHYGRTLVALDRRPEALPILRRATELAPDDAEAWRLLGETLIDADELEEARQAMARVRELEEAERLALIRAQENREAALAEVEAALAAAAAGRGDEALAGLRRASELAPEDPSPRMVEVRLLVSLGRQAEALARAGALVATFPGVPDVFHLRGMTRYAADDFAGAAADHRAALALDAGHAGALTGLALALLEQGRLDAAEELLDRVAELAPDDDLARRARRRLAELRGGGR